MDEVTNIIISGTTKAGTTSLFNYLGDHPDVCPSSIKETGFFLDDDYPNQSRTPYTFIDGISFYNFYFSGCMTKKYRLEATPGYLYSNGTADRIKCYVSDPKIVFILRDPIQRLISTFKFSKQTEKIPVSMGFDEFIKYQIQEPNNLRIRSLSTGKYYKYLVPYFDHFSPDQRIVILYEEFIHNPINEIRKICSLTGLSAGYYENDYEMVVYNRSYSIKNPNLHHLYLHLGKIFSHRNFLKFRYLTKMLTKIKTFIDPMYLLLNENKSADVINMNSETYELLIEYYEGDVKKLKDLLQIQSLPWLRNAIKNSDYF